MKNIQVIDGATNSTYTIYAISNADFVRVFPEKGQDIEFVEDFFIRVGDVLAIEILKKVWLRKIDKKAVQGIHGTLFYDLDFKKKFYPMKRESDIE